MNIRNIDLSGGVFLLLPCILLCGVLCGCGAGHDAKKTQEFELPVAPSATETVRQISDDEGPQPPRDFSGRLNAAQDNLTFEWTYYNPGDYNLDGLVDGKDVFPLAVHFNEQSGYNGNSETSPGNNCIDGNEDGVLNGMDLFLIAVNFQHRLDGWNIYSDSSEDGAFEDGVNTTLIEYTQASCGTPITYDTPYTQGSVVWFGSRAYDEVDGLEGPLSDVFTPPVWVVGTIESEGDTGEEPSLAFDSTGMPCISYHDNTNQTLKFTRFDGAQWHSETVDATEGAGDLSSLVFNLDGHALISYAESTARDLKFAEFDGSTWQIETIDSEGDLMGVTSLALDSSGRPAISYFDLTNWGLKLAWFDGTQWNIETVDAEGSVGSDSSLAFAQDGKPAISYFDIGNGDLKFARFDGQDWITEIARNGVISGSSSSLAFSPDGTPTIAYADFDVLGDSRTGFAWFDGTKWKHDEVAPETNGTTRLAYGLDGNPVVSFYNAGDEHLWFAWLDAGDEWQVEAVDEDGHVGRSHSLAISPAGEPSIAYYDVTNGDLKFAQFR